MSKYTIGVDYGSDSVRAIVVDATNGKEISSSVFYYPRWKEGKYCVPAKNQFRQHPLDYIEGLESTIKNSLAQAPAGVAENVVGITFDTTGSTPVAVDANGTPLALLPEFAENPNAMFVLWKDHTATKEADEINDLARSWGGEDYTKYEGGIYSSEWFWAKILHVLRADEKVRKAAYSWVEHCDWMPALITGTTNPATLKRGRCSAGHKAMWHEDWKGLPPEEFLVKLDPVLKGLRERLFDDTYTIDEKVGNLTPEWAKRLGLSENVVVGISAFDCHLGAIGADIKPYYLSKVMGTSTCDILIAPLDEIKGKLVKGICGQVDGSVVPGMMGLEAGQSAFGDVYAWFKQLLLWPVNNLLAGSSLLDEATKAKLIDEISGKIIPELEKQALLIPIAESGVIALDWMNGRRTPDANQLLTGAITGINLGTDAPRIYRALVEATAFGAKRIADRFIEEGVDIKGVIALGGVAKKSKFVMQTVADIFNMPILVARSEQACALGSAMAAAKVAGLYPTVLDAQKAMSGGFETEYHPIAKNVAKYKALYEEYITVGNFVESQVKR